MSFYTSLSGLQAAQTDLSTISHNLANVSTNGFKKSRSEFSDVMASNFTSDPRRMVGSGVTLQQNRQLFREGSLVTTGSSLDLALAGDGFFAVKSPNAGGLVSYTRNGSFGVDSNRFIVDATGNRLQAYPVETDGSVPNATTLIDVRIPATTGSATATSAITLKANLSTAATAPTGAFDRANPATFSHATATTVYDADGKATTLTSYFVRDASVPGDNGASQWTVYAYAGDSALNGGTGTPVSFDGSGNIQSPSTLTLNYPDTGAGARTIALDLSGSSATKSGFAVSGRTQDGKPLGEFSGITVDSAGLISASYSNGETLRLGRVALANFTNPAGLKQSGGSYWTATGLSGSAIMGSASENGLSTLMSGTIEGSNVDVTEELVELIAAQRNFQANAKALDTASQLSQTIFNIRS